MLICMCCLEDVAFSGDILEHTELETASPEAVVDGQSQQHVSEIHNSSASPVTLSDTEHVVPKNPHGHQTASVDSDPLQAAALTTDLPGTNL